MAIKHGSKVDKSFSASSMTDLMFLLLLFLLIATTLINPNALKLMLPKSSNQLKDKAITTVSIQDSGRGKYRYYVEMQEDAQDAPRRAEGAHRVAPLRQDRRGGRGGEGDERGQGQQLQADPGDDSEIAGRVCGPVGCIRGLRLRLRIRPRPESLPRRELMCREAAKDVSEILVKLRLCIITIPTIRILDGGR